MEGKLTVGPYLFLSSDSVDWVHTLAQGHGSVSLHVHGVATLEGGGLRSCRRRGHRNCSSDWSPHPLQTVGIHGSVSLVTSTLLLFLPSSLVAVLTIDSGSPARAHDTTAPYSSAVALQLNCLPVVTSRTLDNGTGRGCGGGGVTMPTGESWSRCLGV